MQVKGGELFMSYVYIVMFLVGVLYTLVSVFITGISGAMHIGADSGGGHMHSGGHGDIGGVDVHSGIGDATVHGAHTDIGASHTHAGHGIGSSDSQTAVDHAAHGHSASILSYFSILLNPIVAISFLTVFGGIGIMGTKYFAWSEVLTFIVSLVAGVLTSFLLYKFIAIPLYNSENSSHVSRGELVGKVAEVISPIMENGFGEIKYTINSIRYTAPAMHIEGKSVKQGTKTIICKVEKSVFYVSELEELN